MPINDFKAIAMFARAVELGSIRQAALAQGVAPQAASQTIAQLELRLGVRLLHRTTRSLALTEEGQRFLENTLPALAALDKAFDPRAGVEGRDRGSAAPDYLNAYGTPSTLDDLSTHRCSVFRHPVTGKVSPWYLTVDGKLEHRQMSPAFATNDTDLEMQAVLAGRVVGQLQSFLAASHIRAGRLVPVPVQHVSAHTGLHLYYGSRTALPKRVRAFLDLAIARLHDCGDYVLADKELAQFESRAKRSRRTR